MENAVLLDCALLPSNCGVVWKGARWREEQPSTEMSRCMMHRQPNADAQESRGRSSSVMPGKNIMKRGGPFALDRISEHTCRARNVMYVNSDGEMV